MGAVRKLMRWGQATSGRPKASAEHSKERLAPELSPASKVRDTVSQGGNDHAVVGAFSGSAGARMA